MTAPLWLPHAIHEPIPRGSNDPYIIPVGDVFHVAVSESRDLHDYFNGPSGGIESTGYIRRDGSVVQYRPFNVECDAQLAGNSWVRGGKRYGLNSWETQGMGPGEWTPEQVATIKAIIAFKHAEYGTPLRVCPGPNDSGFGIHNLYDAWNPNAHSCPGPDRTRQWNNVIVPWMKQGGNEEDMPYSDWPKADRDALAKDVADAVIRTRLSHQTDAPKGRYVGATLTGIYNMVREIRDGLRQAPGK